MFQSPLSLAAKTASLFPWTTLQAMVDGVSCIDFREMPLQSRDEAEQFVLAYGYDLNDPSDALRVRVIIKEALHFLTERLLPGLEALVLPQAFQHHEEEPLSIIDLLMWASDEGNPHRDWSCALLKLIHAVVHVDNALQVAQLKVARQQIIQRYRTILSHDPNSGQILLGHPSSSRCLPLYAVDIKEEKSRDSLILKLLSKKANVTESVNDMIGIRLVTQEPIDALVALDILRENKLVVFPTIDSNRSRNSLLNLDELGRAWHEQQGTLAVGPDTSSLVEQLRALQASEPDRDFSDYSPVSSKAYRSIHLTCRHLLKTEAQGGLQSIRSFFPYELQLTDEANYRASLEGDSAHSQYKHRQLQVTRMRVLGALFTQAAAATP